MTGSSRPHKLEDWTSPTADQRSTATGPAKGTGGTARRSPKQSNLYEDYFEEARHDAAASGFALGVDTVEGTKHLRRADAGAAVGLGVAPQLATLRARLSALADGSD